MLDSKKQQDLIKNFNKNDWIYGFNKPRAAVYYDLLLDSNIDDFMFEDGRQEIVWRIDDINNKIIFDTVRAGKLTLNSEIPEYLQESANNFFSYLKKNEDSEEFTKVVGSKNYLTRYLCKQGIKYTLSDDSGEHKIHFILDGIDLTKALIEINNKCFTASEIRELARNIENPNMERKIYFYRDGIQLIFDDFKKEMLQSMDHAAKFVDINNSPIRKTQERKEDENDVKTKRERAAKERHKSKYLARSLMFPCIDLNSNPPGNLNETGRSLTTLCESIMPVTDHFLISKLRCFVFNPDESLSGVNELYSILEELSIEDIINHIQHGSLSQYEVQKVMLQLINQFWLLEDLPRPSTLNLAEIDESAIIQQISDNNDAYLFPIRHLLSKEFILSDTSSASCDVAKLEQLIVKIESICKITFTNKLVMPTFFADTHELAVSTCSPLLPLSLPSLVHSETDNSSRGKATSLDISLLPPDKISSSSGICKIRLF